ncbi:MAG: hypothetical protein G3I10_10960 [Ferrovum sp.]|nr:hypothetical protein [Ferrovum sp.]
MPIVATVQNILTNYAYRGVFRSFDRGQGVGDTSQFTFTWQSDQPIRCMLAPPTLTLRDFLPAIPARSDLYNDLRHLVQQLNDSSLPEHRCIAPDRATARVSNHKQRLSLVIESLDGDYDYATRKLVFVAHEIWLRLQSDWVHYLWEEFRVPME